MSAQTWQVRLDTDFPEGAVVVQVDDVPEAYDDNRTFVVPRIVVLSTSLDDIPTLFAYSVFGENNEMVIIVDTINVDEPGKLDVTDIYGIQWLISRVTQPGAKIMVADTKISDPHIWERQPPHETVAQVA